MLEQRTQRRRSRKAAVHAVEQLEQTSGTATPDLALVHRHQPLELTGDDVAEQAIPRPKPPIDRGAPHPETVRHERQIDAPPVQELLAGLPHHIVARGGRRPPRPATHDSGIHSGLAVDRLRFVAGRHSIRRCLAHHPVQSTV
jgi:hypothetical protein